MLIRRVTKQGPVSLYDFYAGMCSEGSELRRSVGGRMLQLLKALETTPDENLLWAVTSHSTLNLVPTDNADDRVLVSVCATPYWYEISYFLSPVEAPWPDAFVVGRTDVVTDACNMINIALKEATIRKPQS